MKHVNDIFPELSFSGSDPRVRRYLLPKKILWTQGDVSGAENLLVPKPSQITLGGGKVCTLRNSGGEKASVLLDYGIEINGSARLSVYMVSGSGARVNIRVRFGESAMEAMTELGVKNTTNDHANRDMVMNIGFLSANETNETGYRFIRIDLLDDNAEVSFKAVEGVFICRDTEYIGSFECDDELVNRIFNTACYTAQLNMQEYLWDGIKRDRLVWIGDMRTEVMTITSVFGYNDIVPRSLDLIRDDTPAGRWMNNISSYSIWWLLLHYDWYMSFGNIGYLACQKEYMTGMLAALKGCIDENGAETLPDERFIDWPNKANPQATHAGLQALLYMAMEKGAALMRYLGDEKTASECDAAAAKLGTYHPDPNGSKQAAALLVCAGLDDAAEVAEKLLKKDGAAGFSTFLGMYTISAIAESGDMDGALDAMREYWGGMLEMGATTFWEDFDIGWMKNSARIDELTPAGMNDIHGDFGGYCYKNFRHSLCHGWASGPAPFLMKHVLGIEITEPGCSRMRIKPRLGSLKYARGTYPTPFGALHVSAERLPDGSIKTDVTAPDGVVTEL